MGQTVSCRLKFTSSQGFLNVGLNEKYYVFSIFSKCPSFFRFFKLRCLFTFSYDGSEIVIPISISYSFFRICILISQHPIIPNTLEICIYMWIVYFLKPHQWAHQISGQEGNIRILEPSKENTTKIGFLQSARSVWGILEK